MKDELVVLTRKELDSVIESAVIRALEKAKPYLLKAASEYISEEEAALRFGISKSTLAMWRKNDEGPAYHKNGKLTLYKVADVEEWLTRFRVSPSL